MVSIELWSFLAIISLFVCLFVLAASIESLICNHVFIFHLIQLQIVLIWGRCNTVVSKTIQADSKKLCSLGFGVSCQVSKFFCACSKRHVSNSDYQDYIVPNSPTIDSVHNRHVVILRVEIFYVEVRIRSDQILKFKVQMCSYQIFLEFKKFGSGQILNFQIFWTTYFTALKNQSLDLQLLMKKDRKREITTLFFVTCSNFVLPY